MSFCNILVPIFRPKSALQAKFFDFWGKIATVGGGVLLRGGTPRGLGGGNIFLKTHFFEIFIHILCISIWGWGKGRAQKSKVIKRAGKPQKRGGGAAGGGTPPPQDSEGGYPPAEIENFWWVSSTYFFCTPPQSTICKIFSKIIYNFSKFSAARGIYLTLLLTFFVKTL